MSVTTALAVESARLLGPAGWAFASGGSLRHLLRDMGWYVNLDDLVDEVVGEIPGASDLVASVSTALELAASLDGSDDAADAAALAVVVADMYSAIEAIAGFDPASVLAGASQTLRSRQFWIDLAADLPEYLLVRYLRVYRTPLYLALRLAAVIDDDVRPGVAADGENGTLTYDRLYWDRLVDLVSGRTDALASDLARVVDEVGRLGLALRIPVRMGGISAHVADEMYSEDHAGLADARQAAVVLVDSIDGPASGRLELVVAQVPSGRTSGPIDGLYVTVDAKGGFGGELPLGNGWSLEPRSSAELAATAGVVISAEGIEAHLPDASDVLDVGITLRGRPDGGWRFPRTGSIALGVSEVAVDAALSIEPLGVVGSIDLTGVSAEVGTTDADGFVASIIPLDLAVSGDVSIGWDAVDGLTLAVDIGGDAPITGSPEMGFTGSFPLDLTLGPVTIDSVEIRLVVAPALTVELGTSVSAVLGPIACVIDDIGLTARLEPAPEGERGDIGSFDLAIDFKPPAGVGVGVDLDVVSGGGYLYIDVEAGSYAGVLDLDVMEVGVSAVAIIDTKAPDVDGWSMFFALFLDLPSIQLGFGFTLTGVGGVAGINRAIDVDALGAAVRSGSLDTILFPSDPIADAPVIIDEFRSIFPPADGSYVFGPVVRIGWGTPTLIEAQLGIVIQLPDPLLIVVLGSIAAILPEPDVALVELHMDVAGVIDLTAGTLAIDASLHDSQVAGFALSGDMALRADFADAQEFLLSVGGFHPRFEAPDDFPDLRPVTFGIQAGSVLQIDFMSYFAITSNSVQCGADFTLDAHVMGFGVYGSCGFDAMIEFSPFRVMTSVDFEVSITAAGVDLMGVKLHVSIEGPNRWHVIGTAHFEVLGFGKDIRVDELIGPKQTEPPVPPADVLDDVIATLEDEGAWQVLQAADPAVTLREIDDVADPLRPRLYANPDATIEVRQTVVPLGVTIEQYGNAPVGDHTTFDLTPGGIPSSGTLDDWFAPGRFFVLSEDDQLDGPEFEQLRSGVRFGAIAPTAGNAVDVDTGYVAFVLDPEFDDVVLDDAVLNQAVCGVSRLGTSTTFSVTQEYAVASAGAVARAGPTPNARRRRPGPIVEVPTIPQAPAAFLVADRDGTVVHRCATWTAARARRGDDLRLHIERTVEA